MILWIAAFYTKNLSIDTLNEELQIVVEWFKYNHLILKVARSNFVIFHRNKKKVTQGVYQLLLTVTWWIGNGKQSVFELYLMKALNSTTCPFFVGKFTKYVPLIYRLTDYLSKNRFKTFYYSLMYSKMVHCLTEWITSSLNAAKTVIKSSLWCSQVRSYWTSVYWFQNDENKKHVYIHDKIRLFSNLCIFLNQTWLHTTYQVTINYGLIVQIYHSKQAIQYHGPAAFNPLPSDIRSLDVNCTFKYKMRSYVCNGASCVTRFK